MGGPFINYHRFTFKLKLTDRITEVIAGLHFANKKVFPLLI